MGLGPTNANIVVVPFCQIGVGYVSSSCAMFGRGPTKTIAHMAVCSGRRAGLFMYALFICIFCSLLFYVEILVTSSSGTFKLQQIEALSLMYT